MASDEEIKAALNFAEFRRASTGENVSDYFKPYYDELCLELSGTYWAPYSNRRSLKQQEDLWNKGRTPESLAKKESIVTNAKPGDSAHNWGCATDWCEFRPEFRNQDLWNKANWAEFAAAVQKVGLIWGGNFSSIVDKPHCELPLEVSWKVVGETYRKRGVERAIEVIGLNMVKFKRGA